MSKKDRGLLIDSPSYRAMEARRAYAGVHTPEAEAERQKAAQGLLDEGDNDPDMESGVADLLRRNLPENRHLPNETMEEERVRRARALLEVLQRDGSPLDKALAELILDSLK